MNRSSTANLFHCQQRSQCWVIISIRFTPITGNNERFYTLNIPPCLPSTLGKYFRLSHQIVLELVVKRGQNALLPLNITVWPKKLATEEDLTPEADYDD